MTKFKYNLVKCSLDKLSLYLKTNDFNYDSSPFKRSI